MTEHPLTLQPIGSIRTPYSSKYSAPRQPGSAAESATGIITLNERCNFEQALADLDGFEYIWVIFWFHENTTWKPKVLPPNGGGAKRGVFATRSPHRPNPIGLSLCKLIDVKGRTVRVENPDMLDGTPILDLKPYIPHAESRPKAKAGWIDLLNEQSPPRYSVIFAADVKKAFSDMDQDTRLEVKSYLAGLLARDPYPHVYRRIRRTGNGSFVIAVRRWRFHYAIKGSAVRVAGVSFSKEPADKS
jgi:tRNA-Thr(GGU) m(6)t(6)A37 methyltransferase TsaA